MMASVGAAMRGSGRSSTRISPGAYRMVAFIGCLLGSRSWPRSFRGSARGEFEGGGACGRGEHHVDVGGSVAAVLAAVGRVDTGVEGIAVGHVGEGHVTVDAAGLDVA